MKTELYFRQVLGRILRINHSINQEAWLFTFAEEKLSIFANRIDQELPDFCVLVRSNEAAKSFGSVTNNKHIAASSVEPKTAQTGELLDDLSFIDTPTHSQIKNEKTPAYLEHFGGFREKLIEAFSPI